jgi:hypothetical protein
MCKFFYLKIKIISFFQDEYAVMPEGWLENEHQEIPDPESEKPSDWDEEMDGDWEAGKSPIT